MLTTLLMCSIILLCYTLNRFIVYKTRLLRVEMTEEQYKKNKSFFLGQKAHYEDILRMYQITNNSSPQMFYSSIIEDAREDIKSSELRLESLEEDYKSIPILTKQISMMRTSIFISLIAIIVLINLNFF